MSKQPKIKYVSLIPKTEEARKRLEYHGEKWILTGKQDEVKYSREPGPYLRLTSRDGNKCICVKETDDKDYIVSMVG